MTRILIAACVAALLYVLPAPAQQNAAVVIVHASNPTGALTTDEVSRMFLKRQNRWPGGSSVVPVDLSGRPDAKAEFARRFHGRSLDALDSYWQQQIFSGRETPPSTRSTDAEVVSFVAATPGAIGYVSSAARLPETVRPLQVRE